MQYLRYIVCTKEGEVVCAGFGTVDEIDVPLHGSVSIQIHKNGSWLNFKSTGFMTVCETNTPDNWNMGS